MWYQVYSIYSTRYIGFSIVQYIPQDVMWSMVQSVVYVGDFFCLSRHQLGSTLNARTWRRRLVGGRADKTDRWAHRPTDGQTGRQTRQNRRTVERKNGARISALEPAGGKRRLCAASPHRSGDETGRQAGRQTGRRGERAEIEIMRRCPPQNRRDKGSCCCAAPRG